MQCSNLTNLDVSQFDTSKVKIMGGMFCGCESLTSLDVSHFNTSEVTNMTRMFCGCESLTNLDLSGFDTSKVVSMDGMLMSCPKLNASITIRNVVTSYKEMFNYSATDGDAEIIVNYTDETSELVDKMIETKILPNSNVKKGKKVDIKK